MIRKTVTTLFVLSLISAWDPALAAKKYIDGPIGARVLKVYDGDTIRVSAEIWPNQEIDVKVRIRGIDAPEIRTRCKAEKRAGYAARRYLQKLVGSQKLYLSNISGGKYYNRVLADVHLANGIDLADTLLENQQVTPYEGGRRNRDCRRFQ